MTDEEREERTRQADMMRDAALRSLVANLVSLGLTFGLMVAISKRDAIGRLGLAARQQLTRRATAAAQAHDAAVRQFQRELHDVMRGSSGPVTEERRGLYG